MLINDEIRKELFVMQDLKYRDFQTKLIPTVKPETVIGVRTPALRAYAKQLARRADLSEFLNSLPHAFFDENQLHAFVISAEKDDARCICELNRFLPYIDNWATCDQLSPKVFKKHKTELLAHIKEWISSDKTYTIRFGIGMLMQHFLDEDFEEGFLEAVSNIRSDAYYVNMMIAWYFATALAKQYDSALPFLEKKALDQRTHNKAIQKAVESNRIPAERKGYLKTLRIR